MRAGFVALAGYVFLASASAAVIGPPMPPHQDLPEDRSREHVQMLDAGASGYTIDFRGTVDGAMTRDVVGYAAYGQGWQPNRSLLLENIGKIDVRNPRVVVNGKRRWWSLQDILAEATRGYTDPADRARAIWEFHRRQRFHATTWDAESSDAVKVLNVYGYTLCGNEAQIVNDYWKAAGLTTRRGYPIGHCVSEVFFDGAFRLLDSDEHVICLKRDNRSIASCEDIVRDHDLVKRTHTYGILNADSRQTDEFSASLYVYEGRREGDHGSHTRHAMDLTLRPGESIEFRWDHVGKQYSAGQAIAEGEKKRDGLGDLLAGWGGTAYDKLRNGKLRYRPNLTDDTAQRGAEKTENARLDLAAGSVAPQQADKPATVRWCFTSPYVFVGGKASAAIRLAPGASAQWRFSADAKTWKPLAALSAEGEMPLEAVLDEIVSPRGRPDYRFWLELVLEGKVTAREIAFEHDIQTSLLSLPELEVGINRIEYRDANDSRGKVRITHRWLERTCWRPPQAPADAIVPKDGETVAGSQVAFRWTAAADPDSDAIADYHFELSEHSDMRWPLSPNFEKLVSRTPSAGKSEWTAPYRGLLNPATTYYWRVRARDDKGVWGPWSRTFHFRIRAPGVPLDVRLEPEDRGYTLHWKANPQGAMPAAYKVYGSDEKGFSASDTNYPVVRGKGFVKTIEQFTAKPSNAPDAGVVQTPPNLIGTVQETSLRVVGAEVDLPNANSAFYRVVAADAAGIESGPSDYAEAPRPMVVIPAEDKGKVGAEYRMAPKSVLSIGDLRCRRSDQSSYNAAYWDREEYTFRATALPEGLTIDPATGEISGKPVKAGRSDVRITVSDQAGDSREFTYRLLIADGAAGDPHL
ncbi:MAG: hypothetical protein GXY83_23555 [Rhodopirellula sp.]|nr:hypothetical protein [Rhodopirellula sp.]